MSFLLAYFLPFVDPAYSNYAKIRSNRLYVYPWTWTGLCKPQMKAHRRLCQHFWQVHAPDLCGVQKALKVNWNRDVLITSSAIKQGLSLRHFVGQASLQIWQHLDLPEGSDHFCQPGSARGSPQPISIPQSPNAWVQNRIIDPNICQSSACKEI